MKKTNTFSWTTSNGKQLEVEITRNVEVVNNIAFADGDNIATGNKVVERTEITLRSEGKVINASGAPEVIKEKDRARFPKEVFARLGDKYIAEELYNLIVAEIEAMEVEMKETEATEYAAVEEVREATKARSEAKRIEAEKEFEHQKKLAVNAPCPKCGTWCYGDCE